MTKQMTQTNGKTEIWDVFGEQIICKVQGMQTLGRFSVVEETSPPESFVPQHFHNYTDEIIYILEGEYELQIDEKLSLAKQGDVIFIPRKTPHGFRNLLDTSSKMLAIITPSGFENFFAEVSKLKEIDMAKVVEIGKQNDLELII